MATPATGVTVSWNSVSFQEVVDLKFAHGGGLPISREAPAGRPFSLDLGTIDIQCLSTANCSVANYGKRATFQISGGGFTFTHKAYFEKLVVEKKVNDVERYSVTLRFAPS
jgi:hypothetical protein